MCIRDRYKNGNEFRLDKSADNDLKRHFSAYMLANLEDKNLANTILEAGVTDHTLTQIKAWLGPQIWDTGSYYMAINEDDALVN